MSPAARYLPSSLGMVFCLFVLADHPWSISDYDFKNMWAIAHCLVYAITGLCVIFLRSKRLMMLIFALAAPALIFTYGNARANWESGNDGGGLFWLLIVGPVCLIYFLIYAGFGVALLFRDEKPQEHA
jgi:hypothetical protein